MSAEHARASSSARAGRVVSSVEHSATARAPAVPDRLQALERARLRSLLLWIIIAVGLTAYAHLYRDTYVDDAYITLSYARNLSDHLTWGLVPGRIANTATSPLNVILLALTDRLMPGSTVDAVAPLTAATWLLSSLVLVRLSRRLTGTALAGIAAAVGLVTNPLLLSAIGLEGYLFALLMLTSLLMFVDGRPRALGVSLGLLLLARPDGALLAILLIPLLPMGGRGRLNAMAAMAITALPWHLFSWVYLGSAVPDTLLIKLQATAWGATTFADGLSMYGHRYPVATLLSIWPIVVAPFALLALRGMARPGRLAVAGLVIYGAAHYAIYAAMGVPPFHWYYTHQVVPIIVLGAFGVSALLQGLARSPAAIEQWAAHAAAVAVPVVGLAYLLWLDGWTLTAAPITTNWGTPSQYRAVGTDLGQRVAPDDVIDLSGEIGTVAYYCDCRLIDDFADLNRTTDEVEELRKESSGLKHALLTFNFAWRDQLEPLPPARYTLSFNPIDGAESSPAANRETVAGWELSSPWIRQTHLTLRANAYLTIRVDLRTADGAVMPPGDQPDLTGAYVIDAIAGHPPTPEAAQGEWVSNSATVVPVSPYSTLVVEVRHPDYRPFRMTVTVSPGNREILAVLSPRSPPANASAEGT